MSSRLGETPSHNPAVRANFLKPQPGQLDLVHASDVEGPIFLGDDALEIASKFIKPLHPKDSIDYGRIFYCEQHNAIMETFMNNGLGQIGSDIALSLPALLYFGATTQDFEEQVLKSPRTPGSKEHIAYLRTQNSHLVAVTTAWEQPHRKIILEDKHAGFDHLAATDFPINQIREKLQVSGAWPKEMTMTGKWLEKVFRLIEKREEVHDQGAKDAVTKELRGTIVDFYTKDVGVTWDKLGRTVSLHKTHLGDILAGLYIVGDREKARIVRRLTEQNLLHPDAAGIIFWGDGVNDTIALGDKKGADWRIAFDGAAAAKAANIGVIASDIGRAGIALTRAIQRHPQRRPSEKQIETVVNEAQEEVGRGHTIIHRAGPRTPIDLLVEHDRMKVQIRGKNGAEIDRRMA